jgi:ATP/maltotriose-dependent transcriptional regulator MalT
MNSTGTAMDQVVSDHSRVEERLKRISAALGTGVVLLDTNGEVAWMDERVRARLNGGTDDLVARLRTLDTGAGLNCCLYVHELPAHGEATTVCLIQESELLQGEQGHDIVAAFEAAMTDTSWFTRTIVDKLKALRQTRPPAPRKSDLDSLSDREREVLGLICEGCSDAQMGTMLRLSQNTIRNHIASLYRKRNHLGARARHHASGRSSSKATDPSRSKPAAEMTSY